MTNRKTEQLLNGIRQAQGAIDEQEPERAATIMKDVLVEMARAGVDSAHAHWVAAVAYDLSQEVEMAFNEVRKAVELDALVLPRKLADGDATRLDGVHRDGERGPRKFVMV